jgi:hypothetical protein
MDEGTVPERIEDNRDGYEWLPLDTARETFRWLVAGPAPLALNGRRFVGLPARRVRLDELRDRLMSRRCPAATRDEVWAYLVRRSRREGASWTMACVGMALPALASSARWLAARYRGDRAEVHATVLAGFVEALARIDLTRPGVLIRLMWGARRAGQAALAESLDAPVPIGCQFRSTAPRPPWGHPDLVLVRAVGDGILTPTEAELISATRLGEMPMTAWAQAHTTAVKTAFKARDRAEDRLVSWLSEQARDCDGDDPVADAALAALASDASGLPGGEQSGMSLAVSGRRRNGRPIDSTKYHARCRKTTRNPASWGAGRPTSLSLYRKARRCA